MPNRTRHSTVVVTADDGSSEVGTNEWNEDHVGMPDRSVNVLDYGATGDGTTDDTSSIHAARDASGAKRIVFPPGTYRVSKLSPNINGQTWHLCAGATILQLPNQNTDCIEPTATDVTIEGEGWQSVVDQNGLNQTGGAGIYATGAPRCTVRNIKITNCYGNGVEAFNGSVDFEVDHVLVDGFGQWGGIVVNGNGGGDRSYIHDCKVVNGPSTLPAAMINVHGNIAGGTIHGARIQNNYIVNNGTDMFGIEVGAFDGVNPQEGIIITGNRIVATNDGFGGISIVDCKGAVVANNVYDQGGQTGVNSIAGIELAGDPNEGGCEECIIVGNRIVGDAAVARGIILDRSNRNTVVGNTIEGWSNTDVDGVRGGIQLGTSTLGQTVNDNIISGNVLIHPPATITAAGIALQCNASTAEIKRNNITNNVFVGGGVAGSQAIRIQLDSGTIDYNNFSGNTIYNVGSGIYSDASGLGSNNRLSPNTFESCTIDYDVDSLDASSGSVRSLEFKIDGNGSVISTGESGHLIAQFSGHIVGVHAIADQSGSIVVDVWKDTYANYPPTDADSITASAPVTISTAVKSEDFTLTGWTKDFSKGDIFSFNVDSVTSIQRVTVTLYTLETV